ncbi:MAG: NADH-quinone oxidoreductase subunit N [Syntrophorhabdales bacterium]|jgi:NADH-quinone oxidoreductase subunit N
MMKSALVASDFQWIIPEIVLVVVGLAVLLVSAGRRGKSSSTACGVLTLAGGIAAFCFAIRLWGAKADLFNALYVVDDFGTFLKYIFLAILLLVSLISLAYTRREEIVSGEYYSLLLFAVFGMMVMVSSNSFVTIFIGLEVMSLSIYILCGLLKGSLRAIESSLKYFLLGSFGTAFFLYGIALIYASAGTIDIQAVRAVAIGKQLGGNAIFLTGMALLIVGFGFKIASVPFHMWTPDVYEGAPTSVTVFMATGVKAAAFGAFLRVFYTAFYPLITEWSPVLWFMAVLTMCVGNITALLQNNMKRLLAYSSIAHAGYILIAFVTGDRLLSSSVLYYLLAYTFMNLGAFTVVILLGRKGEEHEDIDSYAGLAARHPFIALCMTIFLLSLTGIPPLAGFAGKFYLFSDAIKGQYYWLAVIGMLNSAVSAYYYLRVLMYMYFKEPVKELGKVDMSPAYVVVMLVSVGALLYLGIFPRGFMLLAQQSVAIFGQ